MLQPPIPHAGLAHIRLLALDVDGVLSDGRLYFNADGMETKAFHTQDGQGLKLLKHAGIQVALITGRDSPMVTHRAQALGIAHVYQGCPDKLNTLTRLCHELDISLDQVAYCGDDLPDLAAIQQAGVGVSVPNAPDYMHHYADWVTPRQGGHGAVRDICDALISARGLWDRILPADNPTESRA